MPLTADAARVGDDQAGQHRTRRDGRGAARVTRARRAAPAALLLGAIALISGCEMARTRVATADVAPPPLTDTVPIATVLNEIKCDYLDFAYSDYARARRLAVGKVTGTLRLSVSQDGTRSNAFAVPVAADAIAPGAGQASVPQNVLVVPFALDPNLALNPGGAGFRCGPEARLARPIWDVTALAAALAPLQADAGGLALRSPLTFTGQFYLRRTADGAEPVPVTLAPARVGAAAVFVQSFTASVETGTASWFADVGTATAEPRGTPGTGYAPEPKRAAPPVPPLPAPPAASPAAAAEPEAGIARPSRFRIPTAPASPAQRRARTAPPATLTVRRCTPDAGGELLCY